MFALSGMQVAFFLDAFRLLSPLLGLEQEKRVAYLLYPFSLLYAGMTGFRFQVFEASYRNFPSPGWDQGMGSLSTLLLSFLPSSLVAGGLLSAPTPLHRDADLFRKEGESKSR